MWCGWRYSVFCAVCPPVCLSVHLNHAMWCGWRHSVFVLFVHRCVCLCISIHCLHNILMNMLIDFPQTYASNALHDKRLLLHILGSGSESQRSRWRSHFSPFHWKETSNVLCHRHCESWAVEEVWIFCRYWTILLNWMLLYVSYSSDSTSSSGGGGDGSTCIIGSGLAVVYYSHGRSSSCCSSVCNASCSSSSVSDNGSCSCSISCSINVSCR